MANNTTIQIKRSNSVATPASLSLGELAFSSTSNSLFIGSPNGAIGVVRIGGGAFTYLYNGVVGSANTPSATPITDANGFVTNVWSSGLVLGVSAASPAYTPVNTINAVSNSTVLGLAANNELTTTWAIKNYVDTKTSTGTPGGANTQIQFNDSSTFAGSAALSWIKTTNTLTLDATSKLTVGNSTVNSAVNSTIMSFVNATAYTNSSLTGFFTSGGTIGIGNTTTNVTLTSTTLSAANSTAFSNVSLSGFFTTAGSLNIGNTTTNTLINSTVFFTGNSTVNSVGNSTVDTFANSTAYTNVSLTGFSTTGGTLNVGNTAANITISSATLYASLNSTANSIVNSTFIGVTNGTAYTNISVTGISSTGNLTVNSATITGNLTVLGTTVSVNSSIVTINANFIEVADNNELVGTDVIDLGFYGVANSLQQFTGTLTSSNNWITTLSINPVTFVGVGEQIKSAANATWVATVSSVNSTVIVLSTNFVGTTTPGATINAYGNAFYGVARVASNNTFIAFNSPNAPGATVSNSNLSNAAFNALGLTTPLAATSGGTGLNTVGANGTILQIVNNIPAYSGIDGGTF